MARRGASAAGGDLFGAAEPRHSLFFALVPPAAVIEAIDAARGALEAGLPAEPGRPVPPQRLHLTLSWLGEWAVLPPAALQGARHAATGLDQAGFVLQLDAAACFGRGEVVWVLRPSAPPAALAALQQALVQAMLRQGLRPAGGHAFSPHVSLRRRAATAFEPRPAGPVAWPVDGFALIHSERTDAGVDYHTLGHWPLARTQAS